MYYGKKAKLKLDIYTNNKNISTNNSKNNKHYPYYYSFHYYHYYYIIIYCYSHYKIIMKNYRGEAHQSQTLRPV